MRTVLLVSLAALALAACAEREQTTTGIKSDSPAYQGTNRQFVVQGWKPGDRSSWEQELKARTIRGQNDYAKVP